MKVSNYRASPRPADSTKNPAKQAKMACGQCRKRTLKKTKPLSSLPAIAKPAGQGNFWNCQNRRNGGDDYSFFFAVFFLAFFLAIFTS